MYYSTALTVNQPISAVYVKIITILIKLANVKSVSNLYHTALLVPINLHVNYASSIILSIVIRNA
jgi:hypothetical protein